VKGRNGYASEAPNQNHVICGLPRDFGGIRAPDQTCQTTRGKENGKEQNENLQTRRKKKKPV
jgi:hypothetical protein